MKILKNIDSKIAWSTTQAFFTSIGVTGAVAFAATLQWWLIIAEFGAMSLGWVLIYKLQTSLIQYRISQQIERQKT